VAHEQLTPGIPAAEYAERRSRLMQSLPEGSAVLVMAARIKCMSGNIKCVSAAQRLAPSLSLSLLLRSDS
jgi:hypothetical protein